MPDQDAIDQQLQLLKTHRQTLAYLLMQQARLSVEYTPPGVASGIAEARQEIRRIKSTLRHWQVEIEDVPNDEEHIQAAPLDGKESVEPGIANPARPLKTLPSPAAPWYRRTTQGWFVVATLAIVLLVIAGVIIVRRLLAPPEDTIRVGIASFAGCPQVSDQLRNQLSGGAIPVVLSSMQGQTNTGQDLIITGECRTGDRMRVSADLMTFYGPAEVVELDHIGVETSSLDLDRATRFIHALMSYLHGDYVAASESLLTLQKEAQTDQERADLAFLQGNSLLFVTRYEESLAAYEQAAAAPAHRFEARTNRGVAGLNWALQRGRSVSQEPYEAIANTAIDDLTQAISSTNSTLQVLALINRSSARFELGMDFEQALNDCEAAIRSKNDDPQGYLCRAAARYWMVRTDICLNPSSAGMIRDDLARAEKLITVQPRQVALVSVFFYRAKLAESQANCPASNADQAAYTRIAADGFQQFSALIEKQRVHLATDQEKIDLTPDP